MFAILAASGDIGAGIGPWLTGLVVDRSGGSSVTVFLRGFLDISQEQAVLRSGLLFATIFPILTLVCHLILRKMQRTGRIS